MRMPSSIADALEPWWEVRVSDARTASAAKRRATRISTSSRRTIVRASRQEEDEK
jgi:hypothetical protein